MGFKDGFDDHNIKIVIVDLAFHHFIPVLHYAENLKAVLDQFSAATGLKINYDKSAMVPMHIAAATVGALQGILGCQVGSFPQTYLGLPLSDTKLRLTAFAPLISKSDKYLGASRWLC